MKYFSQIPGQPKTGPWTLEELRALFENGSIGPNTPCIAENDQSPLRYSELSSQDLLKDTDGVSDQTRLPSTDTSAHAEGLLSHFLLPWKEFSSGRWMRHRRAVLIAGVGLLPLFVIALLGESGDMQQAYWAVALYFSVLWAAFFYHAFPAPKVNLRDAAFCFFGSAFSCTLLLYLAYYFTPIHWLAPWVQSDNLWLRWIGFIGSAGLAEEFCKAVILVILFRRQDKLNPHTMLFYGLMSGLGFGIYEGVRYQFKLNWGFTQTPEGYYLLNVLRLTSLPFLHAVWSGIAGHFIGLAFNYPAHSRKLWLVAIGVPAVLHGTYNTFSRTPFGLLVAVFSVLALSRYLSQTLDLDPAISRRQASPKE